MTLETYELLKKRFFVYFDVCYSVEDIPEVFLPQWEEKKDEKIINALFQNSVDLQNELPCH